VGANTGFYSLLAATIHPSVHVDAFEPLPNVVDELRSNISLNPQGEQITVNEAAVDDAEGVAELYVPLPTEGVIETSASLQRSFRSEWSETITVDRTTIDAHCEARDRVDVLKIDAECRELQVLAGASATLRRHRPIVFLEIMDCDDWQSPVEAIDEIREELGYVSVALRPGGCRARDRVAYDEPWRNQALWPREKLTALGI
jgi:FkbM family methyltransferase